MVYDLENKMIITLNDKELTDVLITYIKNKYGLAEDSIFELRLKSGRNSTKRVNHGNQVTITVSRAETQIQLELPLEEPVSFSNIEEVGEVLPEEENVTERLTEASDMDQNLIFKSIEYIKKPEDKPSFKSLFA